MVSNCLKAIAVKMGLPKSDYASHSARIGGATSLLHAGADPHAIRLMGRWSKSSDCWALYSRYSSHLMKGVAIDMVNVHTTRPLEYTDRIQDEDKQGTSPLPNLKPQNQPRTDNAGHLARKAEPLGSLKQPTSPLGLAIDRLLDTTVKSSSAGEAGQGVAGLRLHLIA